MQVNSVSFKGFDKDYENFSQDMHKSANAIRALRADLFANDAKDEFEYADDEAKKKNALGVVGSLAFVAGASFLFAKKGYNEISKLINKAKALPTSDNKVVQGFFNNKLVKSAMSGMASAKDKVGAKLTNLKDAIASKIPEKVKSNAVTGFYNDLALKTPTKVGLAGAAIGTVAASRVDDNENGCADMFENGISILDSVAGKAGRIIEVAKVLS